MRKRNILFALSLAIFLFVSLVTPRGMAEDAPARLVRKPYLQSQTYNSIIIVWRTDRKGEGAVEYSKNKSFSRSVSCQNLFEVTTDGTGNGWQYEAKIDGLKPNSTYHYRVKVDGQALFSGKTFRTAKTGRNFSFLVFGDSGRGNKDANGQWGVAQEMQKLAPKCDFVIGLGDHVQNKTQAQDYQKVIFDYYEDWMSYLPFWPVKGNHELDWQSDPITNYCAVNWDSSWVLPSANPKKIEDYPKPLKYGEPEEYYQIDYGNAIFLGLDVPGGAYVRGSDKEPWSATWWPGTDQYNWLVKELKQAAQQKKEGKKDWLFVYFHVGPYVSFGHGNKPDTARLLAPLFEQYGVDLAFKGHEHGYERTYPLKYRDTPPHYQEKPAPEGEGIVYINSGGGGAGFFEKRTAHGETFLPEELIAAPRNPQARIVHQFLKVDIQGKNLRLQSIRWDGEVIDTYLRKK